MHCIWFRQDLRVYDNTALFEACQNAKGVVALFILTPKVWQSYDWSVWKVDLLLRQLRELSHALAELHIPLKILSAVSYQNIPKMLKTFCTEHHISEIFVNRQILVNEIQLDAASKDLLAKHNIVFSTFDDVYILPPESVLKSDGAPFKVFTPYKNAWFKTVEPGDYQPYAKPKKQISLKLQPDSVPEKLQGFGAKIDNTLWPAGEVIAQKKLVDFCKDKAKLYKDERDFPNLQATSGLSPYLALGVISTRQCIAALLKTQKTSSFLALCKNPGVACWISELIWREFYGTIAFHFSDVVKHKPFKPETDRLNWSTNQTHFKAWCEGKTGFPIVDAAMRQLKQTGWMHNRLRMVVAMFLTKTLFIDWRLGEAHFMQNLVDGDFASNNGGWQWSASTGTDAAPYFRIFNPTSQSEKFDAQGHFIRTYCKELAKVSSKEIHNPSDALRQQYGYPKPIVDYKLMREKVITAFKALKKS